MDCEEDFNSFLNRVGMYVWIGMKDHATNTLSLEAIRSRVVVR
jgi:hypothetical protein